MCWGSCKLFLVRSSEWVTRSVEPFTETETCMSLGEEVKIWGGEGWPERAREAGLSQFDCS